jgi:hypothetical protein
MVEDRAYIIDEELFVQGGILSDTGAIRAVPIPSFPSVDVSRATMLEPSILCPSCGERNLIGVMGARVPAGEIFTETLRYAPVMDPLPGEYLSETIEPERITLNKTLFVCPELSACGYNTISPFQA